MNKFKIILACVMSTLILTITGCNTSNTVNSTTSTIGQSTQPTEGFEASKTVIETFWKSMESLDKELMTTCFYNNTDINKLVDTNIADAEKISKYTVYNLNQIKIKESEISSLDDIINHYDNCTDAKLFNVTVPMIKTMDNVKYEINNIYNIATVCINNNWYIAKIEGIDIVIVSQTDLSATSTTPTTTVPNIETTSKDESGVTDSESAGDLSNIYANNTSRSFKLNDKIYTLGEDTLQTLIDNGVVFEDISNANNNIKPNYESETFTILLNGQKDYKCYISVSNFTDTNSTIAQCPITSISMENIDDIDFVDNVIEFAFPFDMTEKSLKNNSGKPTNINETVENDKTIRTVEYKWKSIKYNEVSGYSFTFVDNVFKSFKINLYY